MAQLPQAFNAEEIDDDFDVIPKNNYTVEIVSSEMKVTKAGTGKYLSLQLKVIKGDFKGKVLFDLLNLVNPNETAEEIAKRTLKRICDAVGKKRITDSKVLHDIPMIAKVDIEPATDSWPAKNIIKNYSAIPGAMPHSDRGNPFGDDSQKEEGTSKKKTKFVGKEIPL